MLIIFILPKKFKGIYYFLQFEINKLNKFGIES